ncbi:MAG: GtrA family protein, partial [Lachnospiraceae bacterium]|nr:GtrA family protein [Lachnospiraceae bacterium]
FITNRVWVFDAQTEGAGAFLGQMAKFYGGRVFTLIVEEAILFVFITKLGFNSVLIKVIAQVVIVILNYLISKLLVFRKGR